MHRKFNSPDMFPRREDNTSFNIRAAIKKLKRKQIAQMVILLLAILFITISMTSANVKTLTKVKKGSIKNAYLAKNAVTSDKIKNGEVKNSDIANSAITSEKIADGSVNTNDLANNSVTSEKIADGQVSSSDLAANSVTSDKIANGSITAEDIKDGTITAAKLASGVITGSANAIWGSITGTLSSQTDLQSALDDKADKHEITVGDSGYGSTLADAITAIRSTEATLVVPSGTQEGGGITVPANVTLKILRGALIHEADGTTLTINGSLEAGIFQVFSWDGSGKVVFGAGSIKEVYPEWWANNTTPGTTDMTVAFQAAVNAYSAVYVSPTSYKISSVTLPIDAYVYGVYGSSKILATGAGDVFTTSSANVVIRDLWFTSDTGTFRTSGTYITTTVWNTHIEGCDFYFGYLGIKTTATLTRIENCNFYYFSPTNGILIQVDGVPPGPAGIYIDHILADNDSAKQPLAGINLISAQDVTITNCGIVNSGSDLFINPPTGKTVASVYASNNFFDTAVTGININPTGGNVAHSQFMNCWSSSHTGYGTIIHGTGTIDGITFVNHQSNQNGQDGFRIENGSDIVIQGGEFGQNAGDGISVAANQSKFYIRDIFSGGYYGYTGNNNGISVGAGCTNYEISRCSLSGNTSHALSDASLAGKIYGNNGFATLNSGQWHISSGATSAVISHGLEITPSAKDITITPATATGSNPIYLDAGSITSNQFTVRCASPAGSDFDFVWTARAGNSD